ncbi:hypothetical protein RvY_05984 [Ramazzottius varieornatus]|uniref:CobW/HypB/UreG nucleotide-binding domain-containing protein n=1 Tax=Ramazzottius varieornatus TaxID=947166 RepID=A0A1D1UWX7_RAMVA|nr:hypothetical protein RvY_05984 [Ramazzottius varieornatus]
MATVASTATPMRFLEDPETTTNGKCQMLVARAFTAGIGGPVGSGKTAMMCSLLLAFTYQFAGKTESSWSATKLYPSSVCEPWRLVDVHMPQFERYVHDYSLNMESVKELTKKFKPEIVLLESGGDNLAANFSRELADYIIYILDVTGGDKIPRKVGPGITQSDLLIINKTDLAEAVGASLEVMSPDAGIMRQNGPTIFAQVKNMIGIPETANLILDAAKAVKIHTTVQKILLLKFTDTVN